MRMRDRCLCVSYGNLAHIKETAKQSDSLEIITPYLVNTATSLRQIFVANRSK